MKITTVCFIQFDKIEHCFKITIIYNHLMPEQSMDQNIFVEVQGTAFDDCPRPKAEDNIWYTFYDN